MADFGVVALGAYLPRTRLPHTVVAAAHAWARSGELKLSGGRRVAGYDEDALTMAVEAGRAALENIESPPASLALASTTLPFADRSAATLVGEALGLPANLPSQDCGGSLRAATSLLLARQGQRRGNSLCIASDTRPAKPGSSAEFTNGDAAVAVLLGESEGTLLARWLGSASINADLVDHYRAAGADFDYPLEGRWLRDQGYGRIAPEAIALALAEAAIAPQAVDSLLIAGVEPAAARTVAKAAGLSQAEVAEEVTGAVGFTGTSHPYLLLMDALSRCQGGEKIVLCGFGQGCDAIVLEAAGPCAGAPSLRRLQALLGAYREETSYTRYLTGRGLLAMDWGLRAERDNRTAMTSFYRNRAAVTGFSGGRCEACGTVQFPRTAICVSPDCRRKDTQRPFALREEAAQVKSFTEDWQAYSPVPPLMYGNVQFDCGANVIMEYTDYLPGELAGGQPLRMVFRIKDLDRRREFRRYCWKATAHPEARGQS